MKDPNRPDTYIFRGYLPFFLLRNGLILGAGAACVGLAFALSGWWWLAVGGCALLGAAHTLAYYTQAAIVSGDDIVLRAGVFRTVEVAFLVWQHDLWIEQGLLGRILDFGTIRHTTSQGGIALRRIAQLRALRWLVAERRRDALLLSLPERLRVRERV